MPDTENLTPTARAGQALIRAGLELPGQRLRLFVAALLAKADLHPELTAEEVVEPTIWSLEDGPVSLVAVEPELRDLLLVKPVTTVTDGAATALRTLGIQLINEHRGRLRAE